MNNCRAGAPAPAAQGHRAQTPRGGWNPRPTSIRRTERGQSLILVVLILIAVAALAALFVALISATQARTGRQAHVAAINNIAEAGIRYADYQLTYSAEGADWRPLPSTVLNSYPYQFGEGEFRLTLTYNPQPDDPLSRFIKIESEARLLNKQGEPIPFFKRRLVAYKPVLLTDYLRFVTNKDRSSFPAVLGIPEVAQGAGTLPFQTFLGVSAGIGTATFTTGSNQVTGTGTLWLQNGDVQTDDLIQLDADGAWYVVAGVTNDTTLTLTANYTQAGGTGTYTLSNGTSPLRINSDVSWAGTVNAMLGLNQRMEILGSRSGVLPWHFWRWQTGTAAFATGSKTVTGSGTSWVDAAGITAGDWIQYDTDGVWHEIAGITDNTTLTLVNAYSGAGGPLGAYTIRKLYMPNTRYQQPPEINTTDPSTGQSRYLLLTRDSGDWEQDAVSGDWYNTGVYGYGKGIYINNLADIQYEHNLGSLRDEWSNPLPDNDALPDADDDNGSWDRQAWSYIPPAVEIILHPDGDVDNDGTAEYAYPVVQLTRDDGNWRNADGTDYGSPLIYLPYPRNGVIYAEGNICVAGILPPATAAGLTEYCDDQDTADPADDARYYDLTIVSGGTIYIEGDLMRPNTYIQNYNIVTDPDYALVSEARNSRLALLGRDHVCLNTTALGLVLDSATTTATWNTTSNKWDVAPGQQLVGYYSSYQPAGFASPLLYIRHAGLIGTPGMWTDGGTGTDYPSLLNITVGATAFDWGGSTTFSYHPTYGPSATQTPRATDAVAPGDQWEMSVRAVPNTSLTGNITAITAAAGGAVGTNNDVAIAGLQVLPYRINIDALIYAQEGSWFVLPGHWFNDAWGYLGNPIGTDPVDDTVYGGVPSFRMALGAIPLTGGIPRPAIILQGAITESHTAASGDARDWLSKWSGPGALIDYEFDAGLRYPAYEDASGNDLLRLPKLPCPPGLIVWEEQ